MTELEKLLKMKNDALESIKFIESQEVFKNRPIRFMSYTDAIKNPNDEIREYYIQYKKLWEILLELYMKWLKLADIKSSSESLESIGKFLGLTRERVRQIEDVGRKKLKSPKLYKNMRTLKESVAELFDQSEKPTAV